jgi:hypothetical protein
MSKGSSTYFNSSLPAKLACATPLTDIGHTDNWCGSKQEFGRLCNFVICSHGRCWFGVYGSGSSFELKC